MSSVTTLPPAFEELAQALGREQPLDTFHGLVRRAAQSVRGASSFGCCLVSCSDEFNGELRYVFDRDVGRPLTERHAARHHGTFPLSNLSGRYEPGTFALVADHFTFPALGEPEGLEKLLLIEIAAHVGRRTDGHETIYGEVDRFGRDSVCCGALGAVLAPPPLTDAVTHPWFDKLVAYFGPARIAQLRAMPRPEAMVRAAVVHAAMQAEAAVAEVLRDPPRTNTWVLVVPLVKINQPGAYGALPVGYHLLRGTAEGTRVEGGVSLRTTPEALEVSLEGGGLSVRSRAGTRAAEVGLAQDAVAGEADAVGAPGEPDEDGAPGASAPELEGLLAPHGEAVERELLDTALQLEPLRGRAELWRAYSRPLLRSLFQGLTLVAPEVGMAAMLVDTGTDWVHAHHRREILNHGPRSARGRKALREVEAAIQQLGHEEAQRVLERLLAESSPLREA